MTILNTQSWMETECGSEHLIPTGTIDVPPRLYSPTAPPNFLPWSPREMCVSFSVKICLAVGKRMWEQECVFQNYYSRIENKNTYFYSCLVESKFDWEQEHIPIPPIQVELQMLNFTTMFFPICNILLFTCIKQK